MESDLSALHGIRLSDWIDSAGISRSTAYELLKILGIEPEPRKVPSSRKPVSHLLPDHLERLTPLAAQLQDGETLAQIREQLAGQSGIVPASPRPCGMVSVSPEQSGAMLAIAEALRPPADPLRHARALADAASLGVHLGSQELAEALGLATSTVASWPDGHQPRPGFTLRRQKAGKGVWWLVERSGTVPASIGGASSS
ncbi:MAG: hypothetical protein AAFX65_13570 [Cyanobacteria bacterium J06638_7]